ncbi:MAG: serine/threonine protein kinase, partial [Bacteroidales bacterium]|nr:serine/threonine protein kinase [Bacteroidales bacterium]
MIPISGYQTKEKLYESNNSYVYRSYHEENKRSVIIKILKGEYPSPERIARFKREYEIFRDLKLDGVVKTYNLEKYNNSFAIIMEDFGAESLEKILEKRKLNLNEFLDLAIKVSEILGEIHQANIIHKDINPSNIVWNPETNQLKIIDFGISTVLLREIAAVHNPNVLEGTLAYISPEQTGRMNRMLDYRTDLYSLGVTFYEMLANQLPFPTKDAMELVHCHIAKEPIPPHHVKISSLAGDQMGIEILSKIIMKLMSKT